MRDKVPRQQAIVRGRDKENARLAEELKKKSEKDSVARLIYKHTIFMRLGINPSNKSDGDTTMKIYKDFCLSHPSVWFSTDSLYRGMAPKKISEFNDAIERGYLVEICFAIGNSGGKNKMEYKASVLKVESEKGKTQSPERSLTPNEFVNDLKYIWIEVNDIQKTSLTTDDFIVISSGNVLTKSIEKSQFHFGYIQKK